MAPSQRTNPNTSRFFSTASLDILIATFESIFRSLSVVLATTVTDGIEGRVRFRHRDKRGEKLAGQVKITPSVLPYENADTNAMEEDNDDEEEEDEEKRGIKGYDVVCFKKEADPLELRRLWAEVLKRLPADVIYAL